MNPIRRDDFIDSHSDYRNRYAKEMRDSTITLPDDTSKTIKVANYTKNPQGFISLISDKVRVYKGGSWKDVGLYLQTGVRNWEYQDTTKSYIGFRCALSFLGRSISDF